MFFWSILSSPYFSTATEIRMRFSAFASTLNESALLISLFAFRMIFTQNVLSKTNEIFFVHSCRLSLCNKQTGLSSINQFVMCHIALILQSADNQQNHCYYYYWSSSSSHLSISKFEMIYGMFGVSERHKIEGTWHFIVFIIRYYSKYFCDSPAHAVRWHRWKKWIRSNAQNADKNPLKLAWTCMLPSTYSVLE